MAGIFSGNNIVYLGILLGLTTLRQQQTRNAIIESHTKFDKHFQGYTIKACYQIYVYDSKRAYTNAFIIGKEKSINDLYNTLFGSYDCFSKLDKEHISTVKFAYNLIFFGLSGQVATGKLDIETAGEILKQLRNKEEEETDVDTSKWLQEKDIITVIKEYTKK